MNKIWHDGLTKDDDTQILTASDRALRGDGVFDTMLVRIHDFDPPELINANAHFDRLLDHATKLGIQHKTSIEFLLDSAIGYAEQYNSKDGWFVLNTTITGGRSERGLKRPDKPQPSILMKLTRLPDSFMPISTIISETVRRNEGSPLSQMKSINYGDHILALKEAEDKGANEAILLNNAGHITCATIGNIFILKDGTLYTPPLSDGVMNGITRCNLIDHYGAQEKSLSAEDLENADGLFLTNSIRGLAPIETLNGQARDNQYPDHVPKAFYKDNTDDEKDARC